MHNPGRYLGILAAVLLLASAANVQASPGSVTRTVSPGVVAPGGTITVTLDVDVAPGERFYIIEETPPAGLIISDEGGLIKDPQGRLKLVKLQNAADTAYTYTLEAPDSEASYSFSGIYQIDGMDEPAKIGGQVAVSVSSSAGEPAAVIIMAAAVIVIMASLLYLKKAKTKKAKKTKKIK